MRAALILAALLAALSPAMAQPSLQALTQEARLARQTDAPTLPGKLMALARQMIETGDPASASLLATEALFLLEDQGRAFSAEYAQAATLRTEAELRAGRPIDGLEGFLDLADRDLGAYLAEWPTLEAPLSGTLEAYNARARHFGDETEITDAWLAEAQRRRAEVQDFPWGPLQARVFDPLFGGDPDAAHEAARDVLAGLDPNDPRLPQIFEVLATTLTQTGHPGPAAHWTGRLAQMPPGYLASLIDAPWDLADPAVAWLEAQGAFERASDLRAGLIDAAAMAHGPTHPGVLSMRLFQADALALQTRNDAAAREVAAVVDALEAEADPDPYFQAWAWYEQAIQTREAGQMTTARDLLVKAQSAFERSGRAPDPLFLDILKTNVEVELALDQPAAARAISERHVDAVAAYYGTASRPLAVARLTLVNALNAAGDLGAAQDVLDRIERDLDPDPAPDDQLAQTIALMSLNQAGLMGGAASTDTLAALSGRDSAAMPQGLRLGVLTAGSNLSYDQGFPDLAAGMLNDARAIAPGIDQWSLPVATLSARIAFDAGDLGAALEAFRVATQIADSQSGTPDHLPDYLAALGRQIAAAPSPDLTAESFLVAQRLNTTVAGTALGQAAERWQVPAGLGDRLRDLQDTRAEVVEARTALSDAAAAGRNAATVRAEMLRLLDQAAVIEADIATNHPTYAAHGAAAPVPLARAQALLAEDEALILITTTDVAGPGGVPVGGVTIVTQDNVAQGPLPPRAVLAAMARALRCEAALTDPRCRQAGGQGTRGGFTLNPVAEGPPEPAFDFALAHEVYRALLGPVADHIAGKSHLIFAPDAATMALPFHLLVSAPPDTATRIDTARWLIRDHAISVVPSVAGFEALRRAPVTAPPAPRFLGVGDPLIGRQTGGPMRFDCGLASITLASAAPANTLRGNALAASLSDLAALPDTRCELGQIADAFAPAAVVLLHGEAREATLKSLNQSGALAEVSVLSFATHGLIAGELGVHEAGLVLTPPDNPTPNDDGLLTASEVAGLRLNADLVILSACNTAAGDGASDESLSGLASAFFFAGARSLLVSHWPVYSDAATDLTTRTVALQRADPALTRAQALRQAMLHHIDDPAATPRTRHPAFWAPFMLVGAEVRGL